VLDHYLNCVSKNGLFGWHRGYEFPTDLMYSQAQAMHFYQKAVSGEYVDVHCWQFTPSTFRLLVADLVDLGHVKLHEASFHDTTDHEFFISMRKGRGPSIDRLSLLRSSIQEAGQI
jgi:hypothetical protein